MAYTDFVSRTDIGSLIPEEVQREIIQGVPEMSAVMQLARRLPDMSRAQRRMPVLASLMTASFVTGDTGLKSVATVDWTNKYIDAEELAVIVPIPEAVLNDADYDLWSEIRPRISEAMGAAFDRAVLYGTNAPTSWPDDILTSATAAANTVTTGGSGLDTYDDIMGTNGTIAKVEADGFMVDGHVAALAMRARLRALRSSDGIPLFIRTMQARTDYELDGAPVIFPRNGSMNAAVALLFSGDWTQLVWAVRQDLTFTVAREGVLQDASGVITHNLFQQDMVALRAVMRLGWQVPNPINAIQATEASRYPFAVLLP